MKLPLLLLGASFLSSLAPHAVQAEDWPEFRGPQHQGHSEATGLPLQWSPTKNVVWKAELQGRAWSSPIVVNDVIYMTNAVGAKDSTDLKDSYSLRVMALRAADGGVIWDTEVFTMESPHAMGIHGKNSYASPTPIFENGRIYAHFGHFGTACLSADGKVIWKNDTIKYSPVHGNGGCPVLVDGFLIFSCDAAQDPFVIALDGATGKERWRTPRKANARNTFSFSTPLVIEVDGKKQVLSPGSNVLAALDPATGREIWRVRYEGYSVIPRPVYGHGLIFISTGYNEATVIAIRAGGTGDVTDTHVAWRLDRGAPHTPSMLLVGDELYMVADKGMVTCVDAKTGKMHYQERVARQTSASPLYADGKIYIQDELGNGFVLKPGKTLNILAKNELRDKSLASYAVWQNRLLIRTQSALWCIAQK